VACGGPVLILEFDLEAMILDEPRKHLHPPMGPNSTFCRFFTGNVCVLKCDVVM
jgi:hypothetical protein